MWRIGSAGTTSIGVFAAGQRNGAVAMGTLGDARTVGVTVEPPGGSRTPTLPVYTAVEL